MQNEEIAINVSNSVFPVQLSLDFIAIVIGVIAVFYLFRLNRRLGGKLIVAIRFFNLGMASNIIAIVWSTFWGHLVTVGPLDFDLHHLFMTIGMIFFVLSTRKFSSLIQS